MPDVDFLRLGPDFDLTLLLVFALVTRNQHRGSRSRHPSLFKKISVFVSEAGWIMGVSKDYNYYLSII